MIVRKLTVQDPFLSHNGAKFWREQGLWPCRWISCPDAGSPPFVTAYRLRFTLDETAVIPLHVTADERYLLFVNGRPLGRGSERGDANNWFYESYELTLPPGEHVLAARVWSLGKLRAIAQMSVRPGFLLCAEGKWRELLSTGAAVWQSKKLDGYTFVPSPLTHWRGARINVDGRCLPWGYEKGEGDGWQTAVVGESGVGKIIDWSWHDVHRLQPATLPPMLHELRCVGRARHVADEPSADPVRAANCLRREQPAWQALIADPPATLTIPPHTRRRVLFDLDDYYCMYPELLVSGGAGSAIRLHSAESLYLHPDSGAKGHRDEIEGKYFIGVGDSFQPDGGDGRLFDTLWWQAGRYWELVVQTGSAPLTIHRLTWRETRYPLKMESSFAVADGRLTALIPMLVRAVQTCSHETYYDAPYYEELMYAGDARLEMLLTYVMSRDDRLPRKAIRLFDSSRLPSGMIQSRYPSWETQVIAPFSLWWVMMLRDYAYWRDDPAFVRRYLPGMRATLEGFQRFMGADGLLHAPEGWNFMDWLPQWEARSGAPPQALHGRNALLNWHLAYALTWAADLEKHLGEPELAQLWQRRARELAERAAAVFWDEERGLLAEDDARQIFTEHTQALALLSGLLDEPRRSRLAEGLLRDPDLLRTTYYFSHYLFEAYRLLGRADAFLARLAPWHALAQCGLKTTIEQPEPSRSDCHAWSAHPLFHYFATILGIRPGSIGFRTVDIWPQLGGMSRADGRLVHPRGEIAVKIALDGAQFHADVCLPAGVTGQLHVGGQTYPLTGPQTQIKGRAG